MDKLLETIRTLSGLPGVSGDEDRVRAAIAARLEGVCKLRTDPLGNLLVFKKGRERAKNKVLFSAHMDEVGLIVTYVEESGLLRFSTCGGIDTRVLVGKAVRVGEQGVPGVIGTKALHQTEEKEQEEPPKVDALYIDMGAESREEAEALALPGDRAVFDSPVQRFGEDRLMGKAFDDRAGCGLLVHLAEGDLPYDCWFAFTVQEENGCIGGMTAGYSVEPDIAVAVECTTASDIAGAAPDKTVCKLGSGPVLSFMDNGTIYDRELFRLGLAAGKKRGIPVQVKEGVYGGNESRSLQTGRGGARVMGVSLPCRYIHSPSCVLQTGDITATAALLEALAEELCLV